MFITFLYKKSILFIKIKFCFFYCPLHLNDCIENAYYHLCAIYLINKKRWIVVVKIHQYLSSIPQLLMKVSPYTFSN